MTLLFKNVGSEEVYFKGPVTLFFSKDGKGIYNVAKYLK